MLILSALCDFADGLSRGLGLFFTEREGFAARGGQRQDKPGSR